MCSLAPAAQGQSAIDGVYRDSDGLTEITLAPCGPAAQRARCGRITRIIRVREGETGRDRHNDDPALRSRPILGLTILSDLRWRDGAWRGQVYNPEDGGTYRAVVRPGQGGTLQVQGCLAMICRTRIWPRAE